MNDEDVRKLMEQAEAEFRALDKRVAKFRKSRFGFIFTKEEKKPGAKRNLTSPNQSSSVNDPGDSVSGQWNERSASSRQLDK